MKTEIRTEVIKHPQGNIPKQFVYTWDDTRFPTLNEAIGYKNPSDPTEVGYFNKEFYGLPGEVKEKRSFKDFDIDTLPEAQLEKLVAKIKTKLNK